MGFVATGGSNNCCLDRQCKQRNLRGEEEKRGGEQFARNYLRETFRFLSVPDLPSALFLLPPSHFVFFFSRSSFLSVFSSPFFFYSSPFYPVPSRPDKGGRVCKFNLTSDLYPPTQFVPPIDSEFVVGLTLAGPEAGSPRGNRLRRPPEIPHKSSDSGSNPIFHGKETCSEYNPLFLSISPRVTWLSPGNPNHPVVPNEFPRDLRQTINLFASVSMTQGRRKYPHDSFASVIVRRMRVLTFYGWFWKLAASL